MVSRIVTGGMNGGRGNGGARGMRGGNSRVGGKGKTVVGRRVDWANYGVK